MKPKRNNQRPLWRTDAELQSKFMAPATNTPRQHCNGGLWKGKMCYEYWPGGTKGRSTQKGFVSSSFWGFYTVFVCVLGTLKVVIEVLGAVLMCLFKGGQRACLKGFQGVH